jgi:hypothetical protein
VFQQLFINTFSGVSTYRLELITSLCLLLVIDAVLMCACAGRMWQKRFISA